MLELNQELIKGCRLIVNISQKNRLFVDYSIVEIVNDFVISYKIL